MAKQRRGWSLLVAVLLCAVVAVPAWAGNVYLDTNMPGGKTWSDGVYWSDDQPAQAGNDYFIGTGGIATANTMRTPDNGSNPTFPGDSLTIDPSGVMALKHNGTVTVNDLHMNGGRIAAWVGNRTFTVAGNMAVDADSTIEMNGTNRRDIRLTSALGGSGNLNLKGSASYAIFRFNTDPTGWTGALVPESTLDRLHVEDTGGLGNVVMLQGNGVPGLSWSPFQELDIAVNGGTAAATSPAGQAVSLGNGSGLLSVGRRWSGNSTTEGLLDLSAASSVDIDVATLRLGIITSGSSGQATGTLKLSSAGANTISAANVIIGDSTAAGNTAGASLLSLGAANTIQADTIYVGRRKSRGEISFATTGTLDIGTPGDRVSLRIGRNDHNTGTTDVGMVDLSGATGGSLYLDRLVVGHKFGGGSGNSQGTLLGGALDLIDVHGPDIRVGRNTDSGSDTWGLVDLSGVAQFNATVTDFNIGNKGNTNPGKVRGRFTLAQSNTIDAGTMIVGSSGNNGADSLADRNELHLGATNNILVDTLIVGQRKTTGLIDFTNPGGTLDLGSASSRVDMLLGHKNTSTANNATGTLDVRDGTANIYASQIRLGRESNNSNSGTPSGIMWLGDGMLDVTGNIHEDNAGGGNGSSTLNVVGNQTFNIGGVIDVDNFRVGYREGGSTGGNGSVTAAAGSAFRVGDGNGTFDIGRRNKAIATTTQGTVDLRNAASVAIDVGDLRLGSIANVAQEGSSQGTLLLSQNGPNSIVTDAVLVGDSNPRGNTGFTSRIALGNANTIQADTLIIGGRKSRGTVDIAAGGTLTLGGKSGPAADLYVGRNNVGNTGTTARGVLDLSGADTFTATLGTFHIGVKGDNNNGYAVGVVNLAHDNTIGATEIKVGRSGNNGGGGNELHFGAGTNNVLTPSLVVGEYKGTGLVDVAAGGTVNLGNAGNRTEITVGHKNVWTGGSNNSTMDFSAGTANIYASNINLGRESNTGGSGTPGGTLWLGDGMLDVAGNIHENNASGGNGSSTLNVVGDQTFTVGGAVTVDTFTIGLNGEAGSVTYAGAAAQIGQAGSRTDLYVGRRTGETATTFQGTLDLSGVGTFTAWLDEFGVGIGPNGASAQGQPRGVVTLANANVIDASTITIGHSVSVGLGGFDNRIQLGADNTIQADTMVIGGSKGHGTVEFGPGGGKLVLGQAADRVSIRVGDQPVWTGGGSVGTLDLSGASTDSEMWISQLLIGSKYHSAGGTTQGVVSMDGGTMDADSIVLAQRTQASSAGAVRGTFNLAGGTLATGLITPGANYNPGAGDQANFNFTAGVLTPGDHDTLQYVGDYAQGAGGTLLIGLDAPGDSDVLQVTGGVNLDGLLEIALGYLPREMSQFILVDNDDADAIVGAFDNAPNEGDLIYAALGSSQQAFAITYTGGTGNDVAITAVPEPATMLALAAGLAGMGGYLRRRRRA